MRRLLAAILVLSIALSACKDEPVDPQTGYIKSNINGVETIYTGRVDNSIINSLSSNELHIAFQKGDNKYLVWMITITGVDFQNINLPYTINGPSAMGINAPNFWCNLIDSDPTHSNYGKYLGGTTSLNWNATLTIISVDGGVVRGTFEGEGLAEDGPATFADGKFLAVFN